MTKEPCYRVYINHNRTAVGFRGQYALPDYPLLADASLPYHIKEIERIPNVKYVKEIPKKGVNHFQLMLQHMLETKKRRVRILFRREVGIGDVMLSTIALEALAYKYRDDIVMDYWAPLPAAQEVLWFNPCIRQIYDRSLTNYSQVDDAFDIFIDLHKHVGHESTIDFMEPEVYEYINWPQIGMGRGEIWCKYFGVKPVSHVPKIYLAPAEIAAAREFVKRTKARPDRPSVGLATEATSLDKCLPLETVGRVADLLYHAGFNVYLIGTHAPDIPGPHYNMNKSSVRTVCAAIRFMNVVMSYESMLGHLAAAAGVPQLCVVGRFDARQSMRRYPFIDYYGIHEQLGEKCPAWHKYKTPCSHRHPGRCGFICAKAIKAKDVADRIIQHYEETKDGYRPWER